jgi:hypothetical protein
MIMIGITRAFWAQSAWTEKVGPTYLSRQNRKTIGQICTCLEKSILSGTADCQYSPAGPVNILLYHSDLLCTCLAVELSHSIPS